MIKKLTIAVAMVMCVGAACAARKCAPIAVKAIPDMPDEDAMNCSIVSNSKTPEWGADCFRLDLTILAGAEGEIFMNVKGMGMCANTAGNVGDVADSITVENEEIYYKDSGGADASTVNRYCWCKIFSPAESKWVLGYVGGGVWRSNRAVISCAIDCAAYCADMFMSNEENFRNIMLSTFGG